MFKLTNDKIKGNISLESSMDHQKLKIRYKKYEKITLFNYLKC